MALATAYTRASHRARLNEDLTSMIESKELGLSGIQKNYLRSRWLEQVLRAEHEIGRAVRRHYALRIVTVVGSIVVLTLVALRADEALWGDAARAAAVLTGLVVAVSLALEHVFDDREHWRQAERVAERLKTEGWRFLQLCGHYRRYDTHAEAFPAFAYQVEVLSQREAEANGLEGWAEQRVAAAEAAAEGERPKKSEPAPQSEPAPKAEAYEAATARTAVRDVISHRLSQPRTS